MIGTEIEARRSFPWLAALGLALGPVLLALGAVLQNYHWALAGVPLFVYGITFFLTRRRAFRARFTETALEVDAGAGTVSYSYDGLESVRRRHGPADPSRPGKRGTYAIQVAHRIGLLEIPGNIDHSCDDIYQFLFDRAAANETKKVHSLLADFALKNELLFGADRVWRFAARATLWKGFNRRRFITWTLSFLITAVVWIIGASSLAQNVNIPARQNYGAWATGGAIILLFTLFAVLFRIAWSAQTSPGIRRWRDSSVVITPKGLGLVQGDLNGEMTWNEVKTVELRENPNFRWHWASRRIPGSSLLLKIEGGLIVIPDIYNQPIFALYELIEDCRSGRMDEEIGEAYPVDAEEVVEVVTPSDQIVDLTKKPAPPTGIQAEAKHRASGGN
jgi:hypothetical protein